MRKKSSCLPVRAGITEVTYRRKPTKGELKFGEGATHYRSFPLEEVLRPGTRCLKRWFIANDGLRYTR